MSTGVLPVMKSIWTSYMERVGRSFRKALAADSADYQIPARGLGCLAGFTAGGRNVDCFAESRGRQPDDLYGQAL